MDFGWRAKMFFEFCYGDRLLSARTNMPDIFSNYQFDPFYCEYFRAGEISAELAPVADRFAAVSEDVLRSRLQDIELELFNSGITFTVYTDKDAIDRVFPVDVLPRVIGSNDWETIDRGVQQRVAAINAFLADVYGPGKLFKDGIVPEDLVKRNPLYQPLMQEVELRYDNYCNIAGIDLIRDGEGTFRVLEDNVRTPSGVSYVVENRQLMLRAFPDITTGLPIRSVDGYGQKLHEALAQMAPECQLDPQVVLLSPGTFNSAYFEHVFLAREMGVPLVEGRDLAVDRQGRVTMRTIQGPQPVDVIYRRIDDDFIDPNVFNPNSLLGVPGIIDAYKKGTVVLANAVGNGIADDKALYAYMPRLVEYYLSESPILPNVETYICAEPEGLEYTLSNLKDLVVKPVDSSGGYGIVIGPKASREELEECSKALQEKPHKYISQPTMALSVCPTLTEQGIAPRHVDLRPFAITGKSTWVLPGGLTRVALKAGSLIVNSSQGGGSKDTWVLSNGKGES